MEPERRDSILGPGRRLLTAGMVLVVSFIAFEAIAVATVLPAVVRHLGGIRLYGWAFSAFMLAQLVGIVVAGPLVDRIGMLRPTLVAVALFAAGLVVDGAAPSMTVLVLGRVVQGVGAGVLVVSLNVLVGRGYPPALRPRAYAAMSTAWVIPGVLGPAVAGLVAEDLSWRVVFLGIIPAVLAGAAIALPAIARADVAAGRGGHRRRAGPGRRRRTRCPRHGRGPGWWWPWPWPAAPPWSSRHWPRGVRWPPRSWPSPASPWSSRPCGR